MGSPLLFRREAPRSPRALLGAWRRGLGSINRGGVYLALYIHIHVYLHVHMLLVHVRKNTHACTYTYMSICIYTYTYRSIDLSVCLGSLEFMLAERRFGGFPQLPIGFRSARTSISSAYTKSSQRSLLRTEAVIAPPVLRGVQQVPAAQSCMVQQTFVGLRRQVLYVRKCCASKLPISS